MTRARDKEPEATIESLLPADTPTYMLPLWLGCISWALQDDNCLAAFRAETGNNWAPGKTPLERMIDEATGSDRRFIFAFVEWVNVNIWGPMDGPAETDSAQ